MRIVILSTFDAFGGAAIASLRLHKALLKNGQESHLLVQQQSSKAEHVHTVSSNWFQKKISLLRFVLDRLQVVWHGKNKQVRFLFSPAIVGLDVSTYKEVQAADVIHIHWTSFGFLSTASISKLIATQKSIVVTMHDMWYFTGGCHYSKDCSNFKGQCGNCLPYLKHPAPDDLSHSGWLRKQQLFQEANITFVACSNWLAGIAKESSLLKNKRVVSIPNPIDVEVFQVIKKQSARQYFHLPLDKQFILFAAMNIADERKGFAFLIEALKKLIQKHPGIVNRIELLIFGQDHTSNLEDIPFKVHSLGRLSDPGAIAQAYAAASVFVIPSLEDNLPNTIIESMSCGTPVVGFNTGGIPEIIEHKQSGYIAAYKSSEDLATGLNWVLSESEYNKLCLQARAKVLANYSEQVVADSYLQIYQSTLGG